MRLKTYEKEAILRHANRLAAGGEVHLFGSRVDPRARGGDIDLLLLTEAKLPLRQMQELRRAILADIGEQRLDLVNFARQSQHPFKELALEGAIRL
jgi:predicted nucleotidyltransferase